MFSTFISNCLRNYIVSLRLLVVSEIPIRTMFRPQTCLKKKVKGACDLNTEMKLQEPVVKYFSGHLDTIHCSESLVAMGCRLQSLA